MKSRISIIVPTLNEEKNIELLLFSIQEQTVPYFDLIVVDGGSRDKTISIAKNYGAKIVVEKGLMEFPSRNLGAKVANGEILLFNLC
jgi:glycosyltransferase involved in cell wall biosynthesis